jgi:hypothetical protein
LALEAIKDTVREIEPAEILVWSDRKQFPFCDVIPTGAKSFEEVGKILWYDVPKTVKTSHFLVVQWDGWVLDAGNWNPNWLDRDYIGAPWWHRDGLNVGNGGFSLRSTDLAKFIAKNQQIFPLANPEDVAICRHYRKTLELLGFSFGLESEARKFSFERTERVSSFGFHGIFNWGKVLSPDKLLSRLELVNDYVRSRPEWAEFWTQARTLISA